MADPRHYCTHAEEFLRDLAKALYETGVPPDFELFLADYLRDSVKFLLPDNGFLFAEHDYLPTMFDLQKLPFPAIAAEFTADASLYNEDSGLNFSSKRVALAFYPNALSAQQKARIDRLTLQPGWCDAQPTGAYCVMAVFDLPQHQMWGGSVGLLIVNPEGDAPVKWSTAPDSFKRQAVEVKELLGGTTTTYGLPVTFIEFAQRSALMGIDTDTALRNLYIDTVDEIRTVYELLAALNCANVGTIKQPAPKSLNQKRQKKGKVLFYEYRILDIMPGAENEEASGPGAGTHGSPRTHLRRGHLRRLGERCGNKVIWINATMVRPGATADGVVSKTYRVGQVSPGNLPS